MKTTEELKTLHEALGSNSKDSTLVQLKLQLKQIYQNDKLLKLVFGDNYEINFENLENDSLILQKNEWDDDFKTPIDPNDKKGSCNTCEHYAWDCAKGIEVIDENTLHNCTHFESVF